MPENAMAPEAGDELASGTDNQADNETTENDGGRDDTYFLPKGILDGKDTRPGDILKFKVIGEDKDGNVEVECIHDDQGGEASGKSWQDDLRANVPEGGSTPESY